MDSAFPVHYSRPTLLSDPYHDFTPEMLFELLDKQDEELNCLDYSYLFSPHLPAGTYDEVIYFLPRAFAYLKQNEDEAFDLVTSIFGYCSVYFNDLVKDGLGDIVKSKIMECLVYWSRDFKIIHLNKNACQKRGWGIDYFDMVINSELICESIENLMTYKTLSNLGVEFVESLTQHQGDLIKASWFLEFSRTRLDNCAPNENEAFSLFISNKELLNNAYTILYPRVLNQSKSPTYWRDTLNIIGL